MKCTILTMALMVAAAAAGAQTVTSPATSGADSGAIPGAPAPSLANLPPPRPPDAATTAQKRIEQDGYTNVQNLAKGDDGLWRGTATRGNSQVEVTVDRGGNVTVQ
jgi:hypothetical protein